jgi:hypothetical protein
MAKSSVTEKYTKQINGTLDEDGTMEFEDRDSEPLMKLLERFIGEDITITVVLNHR